MEQELQQTDKDQRPFYAEPHHKRTKHGDFVYRFTDQKTKYNRLKRRIACGRCSFDIQTEGLMLSDDFYKSYNQFSVLANEVASITLVRGKENIDTFYLSPMHLLMRLGLPSRYARHFRIDPSEYSIAQTKIVIKTKERQVELSTSGFRFERLLHSLKKKGFGDKLHCVVGPIQKVIDHGVALAHLEAHFLK
jgi:hypothetical protein